jgi:hypothetical protein
MFYKTRLNPFTNGDHLSYIDKYGSKFHTIKTLRKYTKINAILYTYNKIKQLYKSQFYSQKKIMIVKYYYYKPKKYNSNIDTVNTDTIIFENYIKEFIDPDIKIIWKLKNSPGKMIKRF